MMDLSENVLYTFATKKQTFSHVVIMCLDIAAMLLLKLLDLLILEKTMISYSHSDIAATV